MLIPVYNPETDDLEKSYLTDDYSVGAISINAKNNDRFAINDRIMIGEQGQEKTEVVTVSGVNANGNGLTIGATVFSHSADDPIYKLRFDQVKFYRSTDGTNYSVVSTQNLDVDNSDLQTKYDDASGLSSYYYKFSFYHSISLVESAFSDPIGGTGWRREQVGNIIDEVLQEVSDVQEQNITRTEALGYFNDVNDDLQTDVSKPYDFLHARTTLTRTANTNYINFPTDTYGKQTMWKFDRMDYNYTDSTTTPTTDTTSTIKVISPEEFRNTYSDNTISTTTVTDAKPEAMALDTSVNRFRFSSPFSTTASNVFYLYYWKYFDVINSEGDVIETPTPKIYKLYLKMMYYRKRSIVDQSFASTVAQLTTEYQIEKRKYKAIDRKDKGTPRAFRPKLSVTKTYRR